MSSQSEKLAQFQSLSGADEEFARSFLSANDWDLERATSAFFDGGGAPTSSSTAAASSSSRSKEDEEVAKLMREQGVSEADARAIVAATGVAAMDQDQDVRAPIARTEGRLFDSTPFGNPFGFGGSGAVSAPVSFRNFEQEARRLEAERRKQAQNGLGTSSALYESGSQRMDDDDEDYEYGRDSDDIEDNSRSRERNLQGLFQPPHDILFRGTFDEARGFAKQERKWILVNIQKDSEFFSYVLNRDLWNSDLAKDIVQSNFVFFQHDYNDSEAQQYSRFYKPTDFPHVAVIDPRTGEKMLQLNLKTKANESDPNDLQSCFLDKVSSFLDSHSMEPQSMPAAAPPPSAPTSSSSSSSVSGATVAAATLSPTTNEPQGARLVEASSSSGVKQEYAELQAEPDKSNAEATPVRIRLFDGKTVVRQFLPSQRVEQLFAFVHSVVPETEFRPFDMLVAGLPPRSLKDLKDHTLEEESLKRATVSVRWE